MALSQDLRSRGKELLETAEKAKQARPPREAATRRAKTVASARGRSAWIPLAMFLAVLFLGLLYMALTGAR
jgi:hypothetical protein